jgi:hypothetical protein
LIAIILFDRRNTLYTLILLYTIINTLLYYLMAKGGDLHVQDRPGVRICRGFVLAAAMSIPHQETDDGAASNGRLVLARAKVSV